MNEFSAVKFIQLPKLRFLITPIAKKIIAFHVKSIQMDMVYMANMILWDILYKYCYSIDNPLHMYLNILLFDVHIYQTISVLSV